MCRRQGVLGVSGHYPRGADNGPSDEPGDDDAAGRERRLGEWGWSAAAEDPRQLPGFQVVRGDADDGALHIFQVGYSGPDEDQGQHD
jgi:hypothetical protein